MVFFMFFFITIRTIQNSNCFQQISHLSSKIIVQITCRLRYNRVLQLTAKNPGSTTSYVIKIICGMIIWINTLLLFLQIMMNIISDMADDYFNYNLWDNPAQLHTHRRYAQLLLFLQAHSNALWYFCNALWYFCVVGHAYAIWL